MRTRRAALLISLTAIAMMAAILLPTHQLFAESLQLVSPIEREEAAKLLRRAEEHFFHQRYRTALIWLERARELNPEDGRIHSIMGDSLLLLKRYNEAEESYLVALELSEAPAVEWYRLGQLYYLREQSEKARHAFNEVIRNDDGLFQAHFYLGLISLVLDRDRNATITHWKDFVKVAPYDPQREEIEKAVELLVDGRIVIPPLGEPMGEELLQMRELEPFVDSDGEEIQN